MEECYTDLIDDFAEANQPDEPCPVCGAQTYNLQSGYYYCTICSTQSQVARLFVEEEEFGTLYTPFRQKVSAVGRETTTPKKKYGTKATTVTSWEIYNLVLKQIADRLIALGFPADVKPRILELWCSYLKCRGIICVSEDSEVTTAATRREPKQNLMALFGVEKTRRKKPRKSIRNSEKPDEEPVSDFDPSNPGTPRKQTRRLKAFQNHYAELETAGMGVNASQSQLESMYRFDDADVRDLPNMEDNLASSSKLQARISKGILSTGMSASKSGSSGRWSVLRAEEFTLSSALQIAYAALRLAGCPVFITDLVRLHHQGAFELEKVKDVLIDQNGSLDTYTFLFLKGGNDLAPVRYASCMDDLFGHIGVELQDPLCEECIPKLMDDLKLPREFEYFLKKLLCLIPVDTLSKKTSTNRHFVDLKVFAVVCVLLRLFFGFDDLTEKYQAKFARAVNRVISRTMKASNLHTSETSQWSQLFDIEKWSQFWNVRDNHVNSAFKSRETCYNRKNFSEAYSMGRDSLLETLGDGGQSSPVTEICGTPLLSPSLPFEEISHVFLQKAPGVTESVKNILLFDFLKNRIDFVYHPEKYVRLLEKADYRVHVLSGTARDYDLSMFDEKNIPLFQPYKKFKNNFPVKHLYTNLKSLAEQFCSVWCAGFVQDGILELFEEFTHSFSDETALACLTGSIPFL